MKDRDGLHDVGDAGGAAARLAQQSPALEGDHGLLTDAADLGVSAVVPSLPPLETTPPARHREGLVGTLVGPVRPIRQTVRGERVNDARARAAVRSCVSPGNADDAHSPSGRVRTWMFMPCRLRLPE